MTTAELIAQAEEWIQARKREGWTQEDFLRELGHLLGEPAAETPGEGVRCDFTVGRKTLA